MSEKTCLILTSEKTDFDKFFRDVAEATLHSFGIEVLRLQKQIQIPGERVKDFVTITELIEHASFLLANISEHKPDLMYQIGYAHALEKLVMFYVHEEANLSIPEFLAGYIYRVYNSPKDLQAILLSDMKRYLMRAESE